MENITVYFLPDIITALAALFFCARWVLKQPFKKPSNAAVALCCFMFMALLSASVPFFNDFIKLSMAQDNILTDFIRNFISLVPYENYGFAFFKGSITITPLSTFFKFLITLSAFICGLLSVSFIKKINDKISKFAFFYALALLGAYGICISGDFISLFISGEILSASICLMALCFDGFRDKKGAAVETSAKHFFQNALAACIMLFSMGYIYLNLGTLNFSDINTMALNKALPYSVTLGLAEIIYFTALISKMGAFPFYMWVYDFFKGADYSVSLFTSTVAMTAFMLAVLKPASCLGFFGSTLCFVLILCSVISMLIGSLICLRTVRKERGLKSMLDGLFTLNSGVLLLGVSFFTKDAVSSGVFCLCVYLTEIIPLYAAFMLVSKNLKKTGSSGTGIDTVASLKGISRISPFFALLISICLISLAGLPFTLGCLSKFYLAAEILRTGVWAVYPLIFMALALIICACALFKLLSLIYSKPESLKMYKKKPVFNKGNAYTFILISGTVLLIAGFFLSLPLINMIKGLF